MANDRSTDKAVNNEATTLTRRNLLELAGMAVASVAFPRIAGATQEAAPPAAAPAKAAAETVSPVMTKLSSYMSEAGDRDLPAEVVGKTKQHILDTLA
ncbi:MAG: hypothetical protein M3N22_10230, partial [Acidobacteriota bacterium]|nr:hypothetical protein [Acidobacteriota bacterium]